MVEKLSPGRLSFTMVKSVKLGINPYTTLVREYVHLRVALRRYSCSSLSFPLEVSKSRTGP